MKEQMKKIALLSLSWILTSAYSAFDHAIAAAAFQ